MDKIAIKLPFVFGNYITDKLSKKELIEFDLLLKSNKEVTKIVASYTYRKSSIMVPFFKTSKTSFLISPL